MVTVFWNEKIFLNQFYGTISTSDGYRDTLNKLGRAIQKKRSRKLFSGLILLHDNACPQSAAELRRKVKKFSPNEYFLFSHLKQWLGDDCSKTDEELKHAIKPVIYLNIYFFITKRCIYFINASYLCINVIDSIATY